MSQFPQTSRPPDIYFKGEQQEDNINKAIVVTLNVLLEGQKVYKPWPKDNVKAYLDTLLYELNKKVKFYEQMRNPKRAEKTKGVVEELERIFSELTSNEEVPDSFFLTAQQIVKDECTANPIP